MKSLLVLLALTVSVTAMARDDKDNGRYTKNDGGTIIRIEVGNDRDTDTRAMMRRMIQLEGAVRELQNRVYDLEDDARPVTREVTIYTCSIDSTFNGNFLGTGRTKVEALYSSKQACLRAGVKPIWCDDSRAQCETRITTERI